MFSFQNWHNIPFACLSSLQELLSTYTAVGIMEEWDLSMRLFDATVKSPVRSWNSSGIVNAGPESPQRQDLLEWAYSSPEVHNVLATDLLLYEFAVGIFRKQIKETLGVPRSGKT